MAIYWNAQDGRLQASLSWLHPVLYPVLHPLCDNGADSPIPTQLCKARPVLAGPLSARTVRMGPGATTSCHFYDSPEVGILLSVWPLSGGSSLFPVDLFLSRVETRNKASAVTSGEQR